MPREIFDGAHIAEGIDHMRANDGLARRLVKHTVGESPDHALGAFTHMHRRIDLVKTGAAATNMRDIGNRPETVGPWNQGSDSRLGDVSVFGEGAHLREDALDV